MRPVIVMIAVVAAGCGTLLSVDEDAVPPPATADGSTPTSDATSDATSDPSPVVEEPPLTGTDGAADDGAPISHDATADQVIPPGCPGDAGCERVVFVTSAPFPAASVASANASCSAAANSNGAHPRIKGRMFVAWISGSAGDDPESRFIRGTQAYIRPNGTQIAANWADLTDGQLKASIFHDETGAGAGGGQQVWTGTTASGVFTDPSCNGWSSTSVDDTARVGVVGATNQSWTSFVDAMPACSFMRRLYCFEL